MKQPIEEWGTEQYLPHQYYLIVPKVIDSETIAVGQTMSIRSEKAENARNKLIISLMQDIVDQDFLEESKEKLILISELGLPFKIIKNFKSIQGTSFQYVPAIIDGIVVDFVNSEGNYTIDTHFKRKQIEKFYKYDETNKCFICKLTKEEYYEHSKSRGCKFLR